MPHGIDAICHDRSIAQVKLLASIEKVADCKGGPQIHSSLLRSSQN
jgi:hypothetical protein